ncbi:Uncharacterized protein dnm_051500 [Desulfonema magnum]|uniref:Uncharacterized protein n=1 Tax=Desulfonema magnum TaxID=45655 RepID=A0A975BPL3_9BACT|nr:Uncharacterized protein dnm_051500 [Desulfonema magnum]
MVSPFANPVIYAAESEKGKKHPVFIGDKIILCGDSLKGEKTLIRIGSVISPLNDDEISKTEISLALDNPLLRAGEQDLQIVHKIGFGHPNAQKDELDWRNGPSSNKIRIKLRPKIVGETRVSNKSGSNGLISADMTAKLNTILGTHQKTYILLNELSPDEPCSYRFPATSKNEDTDEVIFPINRIKAGKYLVRIEVDRAETVLEMQDGVYRGPVVSF